MKNVLTAVAALLTFVGAYAQKPSVLSDNHAMLRLDASARYLLLPMQESEENAHVRVIVNNKEVKTFNARLAVSKGDYRVPLDLSELSGKSVLLDITFNGNRHQKGALKDYVCWKEMQLTDTFDDTNRNVLQGRHVAPLLPVEPLRFAVGEHDMGPQHLYRSRSLDTAAHSYRSRCHRHYIQRLVCGRQEQHRRLWCRSGSGFLHFCCCQPDTEHGLQHRWRQDVCEIRQEPHPYG